ncbi:MAG: phytoene/squalene synthase family protein [Gemmatimonadaceae bacterium]
MNVIPDLAGAGAYMSHHSRSFRFATLALGAESRGRIERVYAWCRHTDNLVDVPSMAATTSTDTIGVALDEWQRESRAAYDGAETGKPVLDAVMSDLRTSGGPFAYAEALVRGVRSDLRFRHFETMKDLRVYTHDVASVVGLWLCALHDIRDPWMLDRAAALGHAMQLTNILRDVGEDLQSDRVYLPLDLMRAHGVTMLDLHEMRAQRGPISHGYRALMEDLMQLAEADYRLAGEAIPYLPPEFARAVAVAAEVYADIHEAIRANGYDNLNRRARTTSSRKMALATRALWRLTRSASRSRTGQGAVHQQLPLHERKPSGARIIAFRQLDHAVRPGSRRPVARTATRIGP